MAEVAEVAADVQLNGDVAEPNGPQAMESMERSERERLTKFLEGLDQTDADDWKLILRVRKQGKSCGKVDTYFVSPQGKRCRSLNEVRDLVAPQAAPLAVDQNGNQSNGKRKRTIVNYNKLADENRLSSGASNRKKGKHRAKHAKSSAKDGAPQGRPKKAGAATDFDPEINPYWPLLKRVKAQISRLCHEQHLLQTLTADANKFGSSKKVKQTHEMTRAEEQVSKSKQIVQQCLKECEEALGHAPIADECFDADGTVDFEHILCSACTEPEADDKNDILLCDGEHCNRAYHVVCLPVKDCFRVEELPEEEGWLCPACDCRADILWEIAQAFDLDFNELITMRWSDVLVGDECLADMDAASGPQTILNQELPSDDEDDDEDFGGDDSEEAEAEAEGAGPSTSRPQGADADAAGSDEDDDEDGDEDGEEAATGEGSGGKEVSESGGDDDYYEDDTDEEGGDTAAMLALLQAESEMPAEELMMQGKRQRTQVDYAALNDAMFGNGECYDGEGTEDEEFKIGRGRRRAPKAVVANAVIDTDDKDDEDADDKEADEPVTGGEMLGMRVD